MLLRLPRCATYSRNSPSRLCDDHAMGSVTGAKPAKALPPVLCVDLDGTLIRGNVLWECALVLLKTRPFTLLLFPFWLLSGRAALKRKLAARVHLNPARLPYRQHVLDLLREEKAAGRRIALATAADRDLAEAISSYLGLFDEVHASDGELNLKGANKAAFLAQHYAQTGFEYVGDSAADIEVWRNARAAYVVGTQSRAEQAAAVTTLKGTILEPRASFRKSFRTWINALRGHHWAKNLLLFLPLALSHNLAVESIVRPFAGGDISIPEGLVASLILLSSALGLGFLLNVQFGFALLGYAALTVLYSLYFKKIALLDVFVLSSFYSFRILAGALISATPLSQWFLAFSMFFFLSLAMAKRYSELLHASNLVKAGNSGRGYHTGDRELLLSLGVGSSFSAVVIFSLYVHSPDVRLLYSSPEFLFLLCPIVLYWLSRNWLLAHRGELKEDPVTLAIRDPISYGVALAAAAVIAVSMVNINW